MEQLTVVETVVAELEEEAALARSQWEVVDLRCTGEYPFFL